MIFATWHFVCLCFGTLSRKFNLCARVVVWVGTQLNFTSNAMHRCTLLFNKANYVHNSGTDQSKPYTAHWIHDCATFDNVFNEDCCVAHQFSLNNLRMNVEISTKWPTQITRIIICGDLVGDCYGNINDVCCSIFFNKMCRDYFGIISFESYNSLSIVHRLHTKSCDAFH